MLRCGTARAIRALHVVKQSGGRAQAPEVARQLGLPRGQTERVFTALAHAGILKTQMGKFGRFELMRDLGSLKVREVELAMRSDSTLVRCPFGDSHCTERRPCRMRAHVSKALDWTVGELEDAR